MNWLMKYNFGDKLMLISATFDTYFDHMYNVIIM